VQYNIDMAKYNIITALLPTAFPGFQNDPLQDILEHVVQWLFRYIHLSLWRKFSSGHFMV